MRLRASSILAALASFVLLAPVSHAQTAGSSALLQKWDGDHGRLALMKRKVRHRPSLASSIPIMTERSMRRS